MAHLAGSDYRWQDEHVWTNSWFGRTVCTAFGLFVLGLAVTGTWDGSQILVHIVFCVVAATPWTPRATKIEQEILLLAHAARHDRRGERGSGACDSSRTMSHRFTTVPW